LASLRPTGAGFDSAVIYFNNDQTSGRYVTRAIRGNGASVISFVGGSTVSSYVGEVSPDTTSTFNNAQVYIPNYAGSNQKFFSVDSGGENNATTAYQLFNAGLYNQTTAINQISLKIASSNLAQYSTAYLYGVKNA